MRLLLTVIMALASGCGGPLAVRYVAFGDSTTDGPSDRNYPDMVREALGEAPGSFANRGKSGETSGEGLARLPRVLLNFPTAEYFLYWEGGNDMGGFIRSFDPFFNLSPGDNDYPFATELTSMLDIMEDNVRQAAQSARDAGLKVFLTTYFPLAPTVVSCGVVEDGVLQPGMDTKGQVYIDLMNDRIRTVAADLGVNLVDVSTLGGDLRADPDNYFDCNHLTEQGNGIVAELFADEISKE